MINHEIPHFRGTNTHCHHLKVCKTEKINEAPWRKIGNKQTMKQTERSTGWAGIHRISVKLGFSNHKCNIDGISATSKVKVMKNYHREYVLISI